jgi:hypothetical protein
MLSLLLLPMVIPGATTMVSPSAPTDSWLVLANTTVDAISLPPDLRFSQTGGAPDASVSLDRKTEAARQP